MSDANEVSGGASAGERTHGPDGAAAATLTRGARVGRYEVLARLGSGGMGVVFAARDPELDRKVALKLLKFDEHEISRIRLQREAQALALLSHPNVVTVHDVGIHNERVFIAMEFVDGQTLAAWMKTVRPWRDVFRVFEAAGRGLAAAHEAGLVHRDFKPENVMIGSGGPARVKVMDFGLALADTGKPNAAASERGVGGSLTRTGELMGTPAYMTPEQFAGGDATAQSDQFSFCVAFFEALYGARPFLADTLPELARTVLNGELRMPDPVGAPVPPWLRDALRRGLATDPGARFESMSSLLAALRSGAARQLRRRLVIGLLGIAALAGTALGLGRWNEARHVQACADEADAVDALWNADAAESVRSGLLATGADYAPVLSENVMPWIDRRVESLHEHALAACMKGTVENSWDATTLAKARWCLDERRLELASLVEEFSVADEPSARRSLNLAAGMSPAVDCVDETALAGRPPPPAEDLRPRVAAIRRDLSRVHILLLTGKFEDALTLAMQAREQAEPLSWTPLAAASMTMEAQALGRLRRYADAERVGTTAYLAGVESGAWNSAAAAAISLMDLVGVRLARFAEGRSWGDHAATAIARAGDPLGLRRANLSVNLGNISYKEGAFSDATEHYELALTLRIRALGPEHPGVAVARNNLGNVLDDLGKYEAALKEHEKALAIRKAALGPTHPAVARSLGNLGAVLASQGEILEARARFVESLALHEGPSRSPPNLIAGMLQNVAAMDLRLGHVEDAKTMMERSLALQQTALGPDHPDVADALNGVATVHEMLGDDETCRSLLERALAIQERALAPDHPSVSATLLRLALSRMATGDPRGALGLAERSLAIREKILEPTHPDVTEALAILGSVLADLGEWARAHEHLVRARASSLPGTLARAGADFRTAVALWDAPSSSGRDRVRAHALALAARDGFVGGADRRESVEEWLEQHPAPPQVGDASR